MAFALCVQKLNTFLRDFFCFVSLLPWKIYMRILIGRDYFILYIVVSFPWPFVCCMWLLSYSLESHWITIYSIKNRRKNAKTLFCQDDCSWFRQRYVHISMEIFLLFVLLTGFTFFSSIPTFISGPLLSFHLSRKIVLHLSHILRASLFAEKLLIFPFFVSAFLSFSDVNISPH